MIEKTGIQPGGNPQILKRYQGNEPHPRNSQGNAVPSENRGPAKDQVSLSYSSETIQSYDSSMTLQGTQNDGFDLLRGLVMNMFKEQGLTMKVLLGNEETGVQEINLEEITQEEAAELVADDGYFGVEQTSDRIVDFAIGIAGGDPARIDAMKAGVEQGFNDALEAFGGWLPDISYNTYDAVMDKLDAWANETTKA
jgi:hypothetical protein